MNNVQKLESNKWLMIIAEFLPITVNSDQMDTKTFVVSNNSVFILQNDGIGITEAQAEPKNTFSISDNSHPLFIPYSCGDIIIEKVQVFE